MPPRSSGKRILTARRCYDRPEYAALCAFLVSCAGSIQSNGTASPLVCRCYLRFQNEKRCPFPIGGITAIQFRSWICILLMRDQTAPGCHNHYIEFPRFPAVFVTRDPEIIRPTRSGACCRGIRQVAQFAAVEKENRVKAGVSTKPLNGTLSELSVRSEMMSCQLIKGERSPESAVAS